MESLVSKIDQNSGMREVRTPRGSGSQQSGRQQTQNQNTRQPQRTDSAGENQSSAMGVNRSGGDERMEKLRKKFEKVGE
jgi:hypothetical protein